MSQAALIGGGILLAMISLIIFGIIFYMNVMGKKKTTPSSTPSSTPTPTPTPALPPPPPSPSSYFNETCADLGGGSDIISARDLNDCMDLCRTNGHGYPYSCKGFIYGSSYDGYSPFCRIYNNKDEDFGRDICGRGIKTYVLK